MLYWINSLNCSNTCIEGKKWREADFIPSLAYKIKFDVSFYRCYAIENNKSKNTKSDDEIDPVDEIWWVENERS
jgi:hypothetical protein